MEGLVLFFHIVVCILLVVIVLLQSGKSADLAGAFGGMGSQSTFGPRGTASFLSKMTTTLAILFMVTSLTLWIVAANKASSKSILSPDDVKQEQTTAADDKTTDDKGTAGKDADKTGDKTEKAPGTDAGKDNKDSSKADKTQDEQKKPADPGSNK